MGSILGEYQPKPSYMDLIRPIFHDFVPNLPLFNLFHMYTFSVAILAQAILVQLQAI